MLYGRMPAWATVAVTLGASLIAVLGTLLGGLVQERRADNRARQAARSDRIARGMDVLARIQILLSDADPDPPRDQRQPRGAVRHAHASLERLAQEL